MYTVYIRKFQPTVIAFVEAYCGSNYLSFENRPLTGFTIKEFSADIKLFFHLKNPFYIFLEYVKAPDVVSEFSREFSNLRSKPYL